MVGLDIRDAEVNVKVEFLLILYSRLCENMFSGEIAGVGLFGQFIMLYEFK